MDRPFRFNGIPVKTPDSFKPAMATTSTDDSGRTQDLVMHNTPLGTIESYSFEWENIERAEAALIVQQIKNQQEYLLRYMSLETGEWEEGYFYTVNYDCGTLKPVGGELVWENLAFNATGVYPI